MRVIIVILIVTAFFQAKCQVPIGQWRTHLPYSSAINVECAGDKIYCLSIGGLFVYSLSDNSTTILSKINGLSDVTIGTIKFISEENTLVIGYDNGNIDLIQNNTIYNISDIYRKPIISSKKINNINYINGTTYLSCGFGIVVLDVDKKEIKDTYFIGDNGTYIEVNEMCTDNTYLYAATSSGIYKALLNDPYLVNYANWSLITNIPNYNKKFSNIVNFDEHLITVYDDNGWDKDTVYAFDNNSWLVYDTSFKNVENITVSYNKLLVTSYYSISTQSSYKGAKDYYYSFVPSFSSLPMDADYSGEGTIWIADNNSGLVWRKSGEWTYSHTYPNGPNKKNAVSIVAGKNEVFAALGGHDISWGNLWQSGQIFWFKDQKWNSLTSSQIPELGPAIDLSEIAINPNNPSHVFFGSYGGGVLELNNGNFVALYDYTNSSLQTIIPNDKYYIRIGGLAFDQDENLWVTNSGNQSNINMLSVRKANGQWKSFSTFNEMLSFDISKIVIDKNNTKWIILPRGRGLFAFNENGTIDNTNDDNKKYVSVSDENGEIIANDIYSIAVDKDGIVWVGTNKGVPFFYNPENVFDGTNFYAQQVKIPNENPGQANYLLEAETVTAIAIDGANKKWFGTETGGVFLMSADGTQEILHFTKENSPLLSNSIISIAIEPVSGEVFFATDNGIISYRATATEPEENFHNVTVFPNPVRPGYNGTIAINGLISNADVKISDIVGNVVYQTKSEGGQATWNGRNFSGERVKTGVYLVFCTNDDGSKTYATKILFIN